MLLTGCDDTNQKRDITIEAFSTLKTPIFEVNLAEINSILGKRGINTNDSLSPEGYTARYYRDGGKLLWMGRQGVTAMADTLISQLHRVNHIGFSETYFKVRNIEDDLQRFRRLDFDQEHTINDVIARLEYQLTRAYLTYVAGQRFGFVNPYHVLNRTESKIDSTGTTKVTYATLYDVAIERPTSDFYAKALKKIERDSVGGMIREVEPQTVLYRQLLDLLKDSTSEESHKRIMVNMERCRWREKEPMPTSGKHIVVNIPAFMLYAYAPDSMMTMRIGCGKTSTKTPLLTSKIEYMEINPEWNIPQSIIKDELLVHAGDSSYFANHRYYIAERSTGKKVPVTSVTRAMLASGKYRVSQYGGRGNSLGRIVFRFKNNHAVYLHDTSTPAFFQSSWRGVSHGCVRVQYPFELAHFLLGDTDEWTLDKIRISMDIPPVTSQGKEYVRAHKYDEGDDGRKLPHRLVGNMTVQPHMPVYITYYTIYPDKNGQLQVHPDVYGYDRFVWNHLNKYL